MAKSSEPYALASGRWQRPSPTLARTVHDAFMGMLTLLIRRDEIVKLDGILNRIAFRFNATFLVLCR